jgi:hypothetical protein
VLLQNWLELWQPDEGLQESVVQGLPSSQFTLPEPTHEPFWQELLGVQGLLSLQLAELLEKTHPDDGLHESLVQGLPSLQVTVPEPTHEPFWQELLEVQALLSLQLAVLLANTHPDDGLHESLVQGLLSLQDSDPEPTQEPFWHELLVVQALLSSQLAVLLANTHPDAGLHESLVHGLLSLQESDPEPTQEPF